MKMRIIIALAGVLAAFGITSSAASAAAPANQCADPQVIAGVTEVHAPGRISLWQWAHDHHADVATIITVTEFCGPGWQQLKQLRYFDERNSTGRWMPRGMIFYVPL